MPTSAVKLHKGVEQAGGGRREGSLSLSPWEQYLSALSGSVEMQFHGFCDLQEEARNPSFSVKIWEFVLQCVFNYLNFFLIFTLFYFTVLYWFCHTLTWIHHGCTWVPKHEPSSHLPPHIISLDHPRAPAPRVRKRYTWLGLLEWLSGKQSACNTGDPVLITGSRRSPGERHGNPLQYSCLENSMDRGAWQTTVHRVTKRLDMTEHACRIDFCQPAISWFPHIPVDPFKLHCYVSMIIWQIGKG